MTQLLVLDDNGALRICFNATNLNPFEKKGEKINTIKPLNFLEYYELDHRWVSRGRKKLPPEDLKLSDACFHPGVTFTGLQPFIMVGTVNGIVM